MYWCKYDDTNQGTSLSFVVPMETILYGLVTLIFTTTSSTKNEFCKKCMMIIWTMQWIKLNEGFKKVDLWIHRLGSFHNENHDLAIARQPSKGSRHTDYTFVTDRQITHLSQTDRFHICYWTEALKDTAFYSLGWFKRKRWNQNGVYLRRMGDSS